MNANISLKDLINKIWFGLLAIYILASYLAQDVLLPSKFNTIALYVFLAFSLFAIICSGKIKLTPILGWELICLALALVAMIYSPSFSVTSGTFYMMIVNLVLVFIFTQMQWNKKRFDMVMKTFVLSSFVLMLALTLTGNLKDSSESGRLGEDLAGNANKLATMLMVSAIYALWLIISSQSKRTKVFAFISLLITYFGMFLSGGRKYIILPIIFAYVLLLNKTDNKKRTHIIKNTIIIAAMLLGLYLLIMKVPFFYEIIGNRFESFFALFGGDKAIDGSTLKRKEMIEAAIKQWPKSPILGHGFDSFKYYNKTSVTGQFYYSHNNFLELLYNQGLLGFVSYYWFYVYLFSKASKYKATSLRKGFVLATVITTLAFEIVDVTYSITPVQFMLCFAFILVDPFLNSEKRGFDC